jgi:hypothetical protein
LDKCQSVRFFKDVLACRAVNGVSVLTLAADSFFILELVAIIPPVSKKPSRNFSGMALVLG